MATYNVTTNFGVKDNLESGDVDKKIKGSEFTTEFTNISTAVNSKADTTVVNAVTTTANAALPKSGGAMTGAITTNSTFDGVDIATRDGVLTTTTTTANAALPKTGGAMTGAITTNSTFDGVDIATRDAVLTTTTTTANAALPKAGGAMTGPITTNSTFDGRDVATDGTKLDTIEASATADQTDAEIRTAVEAATDSNVFTDADHTKLNAIEANADVTDTANVTAAGALMDSEVTNLAQVKAFASTDYATAAQGTLATNALPKAGGTLTGALTLTTASAASATASTFKNGTLTAGKINTHFTNTDGYFSIGNKGAGLQFVDFQATRYIVPYNVDINVNSDNLIDLGNASARFDDIYATNATIQTSDRNEKQDIEELSEAETRVAVACKGLLRKFRWKSAVEEKGDEARTHFGIIAQDLQAAFEAEGLDAGNYAMFISTTWTNEDGEEQTRLGVRYSELLAFIIGGI
jgi:hypothetical protein